MTQFQAIVFTRVLLMIGVGIPTMMLSTAARADQAARKLIRVHCFECHNDDHAEAKINLSRLTARPDFPRWFATWRKVATMVETEKMPPKGSKQPSRVERRRLVKWIRDGIRRAADRHARDPGPVTLRRLTSAEYAYTIEDLTGLDLKQTLQKSLVVADAVGGEGFANVGDVQFMQDSTLERYLDAAKRIASHAVIGAGPLRFFRDPGKTGFELSAITRIQDIYRAHGFRSSSGEGGEPFGMDRYPRAFFVAWQFEHRQPLGLANRSVSQLAKSEQIDVRFARYIWSVMKQPRPSFPLSEIVAGWRRLPRPTRADRKMEKTVRARCAELHKLLRRWQSRFGQNPDAKEEAPVLNQEAFHVTQTKSFDMLVNWPKGTKVVHLRIMVESANRKSQPRAIVVWKNPKILFRIPPNQDKKTDNPLITALTPETRKRLHFGKHPRGGQVGPNDFVTSGTRPTLLVLTIPPGATSAKLVVEAQLDVKHGEDAIVRCTINQREETDQGKQVSALLAVPNGSAYKQWRKGVLHFAHVLPEVSHREPAPSDRDPIPAPFDNSYNNAERNLYHYQIKYHRDDRFLVQNIINVSTRRTLDQAWVDLLGSFEYHDAFLRSVARKFKLKLGKQRIDGLDPQWLTKVPSEPRGYIERLQRSHRTVQAALKSAEPGRVRDVIRFAQQAWRRPLTRGEEGQLSRFYLQLRKTGLPHRPAIRTLLVRVLMAPDFLYRAERSLSAANTAKKGKKRDADSSAAIKRLSDWELANRLSFFLWSSVPDDQLRAVARRGGLNDPRELVRQTRRMLRDPKARRMATEFFGQWFGFYRFDQFRGIDTNRFPEFTDTLKSDLHNEAVSFFDYIIRNDRPVREILFADYAFLNKRLGKHYRIDRKQLKAGVTRIEGLREEHRGGLLGLGAVLAVTSAPRRTSPVKRGDWILRRILGTPVPPPPADAGSIAADDLVADGLSVKQRLAAHRRKVSCRNCHARIDPLGFALEHYDALGRFRSAYRKNRPIESTGQLGNGHTIAGLAGLRAYLQKKDQLFYRTLSKKLVGYALGRRESISDVRLIERMMADIGKDGRFGKLVERIVTSPQFRYRRSTTSIDKKAKR